MGRSLGEMNSGAEKAKGVTGYEGILPPADKGRAEASPSKAPKTEDVLQRFVDQTPRTDSSGSGGSRPVERATNVRTREVASPLLEMHQHHSAVINAARSLSKPSLTEDQHDALDIATAHLSNSVASYHKARTEGGLHTNNMDNDVAHGHLQDAVKHLSYAHDTLVQSGVHETLQNRYQNSPMPSSSAVKNLVTKSRGLERRGVDGKAGALKPYKQGFIGRKGKMRATPTGMVIENPGKDGKMEGAEIDRKGLNDLAQTFGRNHPAIQKLRNMQGTPRGQRPRILPDDRRDGVVEAKGAGVAKDAPAGVNPKKRASSKRVDTEYRTDANPSGNTGGKPKF